MRRDSDSYRVFDNSDRVLVFLGQFTTNDDNLLNNRFWENLDDTKKEGDVEGYLVEQFAICAST